MIAASGELVKGGGVAKSSSRRRRTRPSGWRAWLWFAGSRLVVGVVLGAVVVFGFLLWAVSQGEDAEPVAAGQPVEPFQLPNVVTGQPFDAAPYLGREPVVVVSYTGFF